jgi:hypothetical protein
MSPLFWEIENSGINIQGSVIKPRFLSFDFKQGYTDDKEAGRRIFQPRIWKGQNRNVLNIPEFIVRGLESGDVGYVSLVDALKDVVPFMHLIQLFYMLTVLRVARSNEVNMKKFVCFLDEVNTMTTRYFSALTTIAEREKKLSNSDKAPDVERAEKEYLQDILISCANLPDITNDIKNTQGGLALMSFVLIGQEADENNWAPKNLIKAGTKNIDHPYKNLYVAGTPINILHASASATRDGKRALGSPKLLNACKDNIEELQFATSGSRAVKASSNEEALAKGPRGVFGYYTGAFVQPDVKIFKSYLVLNDNDYNINDPDNSGPFVRGVLGAVSGDVREKIERELVVFNDGGTTVEERVGFLGLLNWVVGTLGKSASDLEVQLNSGYDQALQAVKMLNGNYNTVEDFLFDFSKNSILTDITDITSRMSGEKQDEIDDSEELESPQEDYFGNNNKTFSEEDFEDTDSEQVEPDNGGFNAGGSDDLERDDDFGDSDSDETDFRGEVKNEPEQQSDTGFGSPPEPEQPKQGGGQKRPESSDSVDRSAEQQKKGEGPKKQQSPEQDFESFDREDRKRKHKQNYTDVVEEDFNMSENPFESFGGSGRVGPSQTMLGIRELSRMLMDHIQKFVGNFSRITSFVVESDGAIAVNNVRLNLKFNENDLRFMPLDLALKLSKGYLSEIFLFYDIYKFKNLEVFKVLNMNIVNGRMSRELGVRRGNWAKVVRKFRYIQVFELGGINMLEEEAEVKMNRRERESKANKTINDGVRRSFGLPPMSVGWMGDFWKSDKVPRIAKYAGAIAGVGAMFWAASILGIFALPVGLMVGKSISEGRKNGK